MGRSELGRMVRGRARREEVAIGSSSVTGQARSQQEILKLKV